MEDFELVNDKENKYDRTSDLYPWVITKPYEETYRQIHPRHQNYSLNSICFNFQTCVDYVEII